MERDATIARDQKRYGKEMPRLPEIKNVMEKMPRIARGWNIM
jgi:hypothetical protein